MYVSILILFVFLLVPKICYAWGPGVHLALGNHILSNLHLLSEEVAELLFVHQNSFLYGCLSADIFIGKGSKFNPVHSHNWDMGFKLLQAVEHPQLCAYAYGYLSHLAADIVAHNFFVPNMLGIMPVSGKFSHVYVEMQADRMVGWDVEQARYLFRLPSTKKDSSLLAIMDKKRWPFMLKKQIYRGSILLAGKKTYNNSLYFANLALPVGLRQRYLQRMLALSTAVLFDFLKNPQKAVALQFDPIGSTNLQKVKDFRRNRRFQFKMLKRKFLFPLHRSLLALENAGFEQPFFCTARFTGIDPGSN